MISTSSGQLSVKHSKTGKRTILMISFLALLKTTFCQTLIQNDAGEARGPSRKMRLEQLVRNSAGINSIRPLYPPELALEKSRDH